MRKDEWNAVFRALSQWLAHDNSTLDGVCVALQTLCDAVYDTDQSTFDDPPYLHVWYDTNQSTLDDPFGNLHV